jgi:hypothetical protein
MKSALLGATALVFADPGGGTSSPQLTGAFGVKLWSDAEQLPDEFTELPPQSRVPYRVYQGRDPDRFFHTIQISATPLSNTVMRVAAFKAFKGSSSFARCLDEYLLLKAEIEDEGAGLFAVPFFQKDEPEELVSSGLTTVLSTGRLGSLLPWGRWVRISCEAQDEGATLSVDYNVNSDEQKLALEEARRVSENIGSQP